MLDERVLAVLRRLEEEDARDDAPSRPVRERSLAIASSSGALLFGLAAGRVGCELLEIGGSLGYSSLWLGAAARLAGGRLTSLEAEPAKVPRLIENVAAAGLGGWVEIVPGDAFETLPGLGGGWGLVFLDAWKEDYESLFGVVRPRLRAGSVVVADNVVSHRETLAAYSAARQEDPTLASVTVPLDNGLEVTSVLTDGLLSG